MQLIGSYYKEKVQSLPENQRRQLDLPNWKPDTKIVNELFGYTIYCGKERISCRSENEARYIYSLWSYEWTDFWVPTDDKYLEEILPKLLSLKKGHDEIIHQKTHFYTNTRIKNELRRRIYLAATLRENKKVKEEKDLIEVEEL